MEERIKELIRDEVPDADVESDQLVDDGTLDSLAITGLIAALSMEFGITIPYEEIFEENFNSAASLSTMVRRLMK